MAKSWVGHNNKVFKKAMDAYASIIKVGIRDVMQDVARQMHEYISDTTYNQGGGNMPYYTGNLSDGTGLGVYIDGALTAYIPPQRASVEQTNNGVTEWGYQDIREALSFASSEYAKGLWVVLFSTTSYAFKVDDRGSKYWEAGFFSQGLVEQQLLPKFKTAFAREFPNIARQLTTI